MTNEQLIDLLTAGAVPLLALLFGLLYKFMERSDRRNDTEAEEERKQLAEAKQTHRQLLVVRERFTWLRDRAIRRLEQALERARAKREPELIKGLEDAIKELEDVQLPPLE